MRRLRNIHLTHRHAVAFIMFLFALSITFGPNLQPLTGALAWIDTTLGIHPNSIAIASVIGGAAILVLKLKGLPFIIATAPLMVFYSLVVAYTRRNGFNIGTTVFSLMSYLYILRAAND